MSSAAPERQRGRHRGIDRIAAAFDRIDRCICRQRMNCGDGAVGANDRSRDIGGEQNQEANALEEKRECSAGIHKSGSRRENAGLQVFAADLLSSAELKFGFFPRDPLYYPFQKE